VLSTVALALMLVVVALIVVHTDWGREQLRERVEAALNSSFPGGAKVGKIEGSVLGELTVRDVELHSIDGKPAITIGSLQLEAELLPLFGKTARIEHLLAEDVRIVAGNAPLTKPDDDADDGSDSEPSAWSIELPAIEVRRAKLEVAGQAMTLDQIEMSGSVGLPAGKPIDAKLAGTGKWRERGLPVVFEATLAIGDSISIPTGNVSIGGVEVTATALVVDPAHPTGRIDVTGPAAAIAAIAPGVELPDEVALAITASTPAGGGTQLEIEGSLGATRVRGAIRGDAVAKTADGFIGIEAIDLAKLTRGRATGHGEVALVVHADRAGVRGVAGIRGTAEGVPASDATIFIDSTWQTASLIALVANHHARAVAVATGSRVGSRVELASARVVARGKDLAAATGNRVAVTSRGDVRAEVWLDKPGTLAPALELDVSGKLGGKAIAYDDLRVGSLAATFGGKVHERTGWARADVRGVVRAGEPLGRALVNAKYLKDGRIRTTVTAFPAAADVVVAAGAEVTLGEVVEVAIGNHRITPSTGKPWTGKGGRISIGKDKVTVRGFTTTNGSGRAGVSATIVPATGALDATVEASELPASAIDATYRGTGSGKLELKRRGRRWDGTGTFEVAELVLAPDAPVLDGKAVIGIHGRNVTVDVRGKSPSIGAVRFELDVDGPRDVTDVVAWRRLERDAVRSATLTVEQVDLASATPTGGKIDGNIRLGSVEATPNDRLNRIEVKGVQTPLGLAEGVVTISPMGNDLFASWNALVSDLGEAKVNVRITIPEHPFDPLAWKQLGRGVVRSVVASFDDIAIDPAKLAKLGVTAPYKGRANVRLAMGTAATTAKLDVDVRGIEGGVLVKPLDVHLEASTDSTDTTVCAWVARTVVRAKDERTSEQALDCAKSGGLAAGAGGPPNLIELKNVRIPVTFSTWLNAPKTALAAKLEGKLLVPSQSVPELMTLVGRSDFIAKPTSTLDGTITFTGTLGKPGAHGAITARNLELRTDVAGRKIPELKELKVVARWDGIGGKIDVTALESDHADPTKKKELIASATGRIDQLAAAVVTVRARELDLAPLAAFLPGELAASTGILRGTMIVDGLDLATSRIRGDLHLEHAQIPIAPVIGTLRDTRASVLMADSGITLKANGILNACRKEPEQKRPCTENVTLRAEAPNDLSTLTANLTVMQISPLAEFEPIINGKARLALRRTGRKWTGEIVVFGATVFVPESVADDLLEADDPSDVYFVEKPPPESLFRRTREPKFTWLDARVRIEPTAIRVPEYGVTAAVKTSDLRLLVGDTIGLEGKIYVERGAADDIFGRRYQIERNAIVTFERTLDPVVDLAMSSQLGDLLLNVKVQGKPSDADFPKLTFASDPPGRYNEGELFGFFLGGEPGGDAAAQAKEAGLGVGASVLSQYVARQVKKYMPKRLTLDVIKCEAATSAVGASCTLGKRFLDDELYIAYKRRLAALPNENADEAQIQYYLSREWFLEGVGGSANIIGADLLWRRRW
jgi:hypothetical protein